jgi:hypothetical protein
VGMSVGEMDVSRSVRAGTECVLHSRMLLAQPLREPEPAKQEETVESTDSIGQLVRLPDREALEPLEAF